MRLIDADALKKAFKKSPFVNEVHLYYARQLINLAPTVKRPHGEWIEHIQFISMGYFVSEYECSNCHDDVWQKTEWQFCPNCGARMKEGEEK